MAQMNAPLQVVQVRPQPNVYTVLMAVSAIMLLATIVVVLTTLMSPVGKTARNEGGYDLSFEQVITGNDIPGLPKK